MPQPATPPSRIGTVTLTAHVPKEIRDRLKILAVKRGKTMNDLLAEAIEDLFAKHGDG
jgi:predicted DNA-binding protein